MLLTFVRLWLPAIVTLAGVVVMIAGGFDDIALEGGAGLIGAGLSIWLMNVLLRVGLNDDEDRDREDAARDFYDAHGHWPDEPAPPGRPAPAADEARPTQPERSGGSRTRMPPRRPG